MPFGRHGVEEGIEGQGQKGKVGAFMPQEQTSDEKSGDDRYRETDQDGIQQA
jgi:hypothetical protein